MRPKIKSRVFEVAKNDFLFYAALIGLVFIKLWLISGEEIFAASGGHDQAWHVLAARRIVWLGNNYDPLTFVHLPVSPLWIAMVYFTGIPLRIGVEFFFIGTGIYFVYALRALLIPRLITLICYVFIIFNPWTFRLFNNTLAEIPYTPLMLALAASAILMFAHHESPRCLIHASFLGLWSALLWNLRKENILIALFILMVTLLSLIHLKMVGKPWGEILREMRMVFFIPVTIVVLITVFFLSLNYIKWSMFATTEFSGSGYRAAYKALLRIQPKSPQGYVSITADSRRSAYEVSPTFSELRVYLEDPLNGYSRETERVTKIRNEIATGWFYWALRDAAAQAGHLKSARDGDAFFKKVAKEINAALDDGRLKSRFVPLTFLPPDVQLYLPELPKSFLKIYSCFVSRYEMPSDRDDAAPELMQVYDRVTNRRAAITNRITQSIRGWVICTNDQIVRITLLDKDGALLGETSSFLQREDVRKAYQRDPFNKLPLNTGFYLLLRNSANKLIDSRYVFTTESGKEFTAAYDKIKQGERLVIDTDSKGSALHFFIEANEKVEHAFGIPEKMQKLIWKFHGHIVMWLTYAALAGLIVLLLFRRIVRWRDPVYAVLTLLLVAVLSRMALFTLLDASSWPANQPRYLLPVMPLYSCFLILLLYQVWSVVRERFSRGAKDKHSIEKE